MKYYVVADVHGFYSQMIEALTGAGYFADLQPHKLLVCGDLFDRGPEAAELQDFILDLLNKDEVILIRGNHEDLFVDMLDNDGGIPFDHHLSNGTYGTALQLTGYDKRTAYDKREEFVEKAKGTPLYTTIIPTMKDYFETDKYIFVHAWLPVHSETSYGVTKYSYNHGWRDANPYEWKDARWYNGMDMYKQIFEEGKTIVCGHWHCSYGHAKVDWKRTEFGPEADFSPFYDDGIIAIDGCTAHSGIVNCIVIED